MEGYTWTGTRHLYTVKTRIDRAVANYHWLDMFPTAYVQILPWNGSDHCPLLIHTELYRKVGYKMFRYDNRWKCNLEVRDLVAKTWNTHCSTIPRVIFSKAIAKCRVALSRWKSSTIQNSQKQIVELRNLLNTAYEASQLDYNLIHSLKSQLQFQYKMEEEYWKLKSRILWLQVGARNTRYIHAKTKQRRAFNRILHLRNEKGHHFSKPEDLTTYVVSDDIQRILQLRPSITSADDVLTWAYTAQGSYSVKSGYYIQRRLITENTVPECQSTRIPDEVKQWRVAHNSLHVSDNLKNRRLNDGVFGRCVIIFSLNKREIITHTIWMAFIDEQQWEDSLHLELSDAPHAFTSEVPLIHDVIEDSSAYYCLVDASWALDGPYTANKAFNCFRVIRLYRRRKLLFRQNEYHYLWLFNVIAKSYIFSLLLMVEETRSMAKFYPHPPLQFCLLHVVDKLAKEARRHCKEYCIK
ncbi:unnamed protein product, partial [Thlaspi arvense]